jgi:predicted DsbA family dithiol-disulfide isomerase
MQVEIWSDIVCPWCYIGRRRLEKALVEFEHGEQVGIVWRSFQLDPTALRQYGGSVDDMLVDMKGISRQQAEGMHAQLTALAAQDGLDYRFDLVRPGNSLDAHRVIHLAASHHLQNEMKERLQKAYFTDGLSVSDPDTLVKLAAEVGLDAEETTKMLATDAYTADVRADEQEAQELGIRGVPFFVIDQKYAVSGAQPVTVFISALERAWDASHQSAQAVSADQEAE